MTLSGEQWLDQVLRPTVAAVNRGGIPADARRLLGDRLFAQVQALADTGVLTDDQENAALDALDQAGILPEISSTSASMPSMAVTPALAARTPAEPPSLRAVLPGPRHLGQLAGRPVTLISAELWTDRFRIDLYTDPGPDYRASRKRHLREHLEWLRRQRRGHPTGRPTHAPAPAPLQALTWELRDTHGTEYHRTGGSGESADYLDRQRLQWSPAPPPNLDHLTLLATDTTGTVVFHADIPIPRQTP